MVENLQRLRAASVPIALVLGLAACSPAPTKDEQRARAIEQSFLGRFVGTLERQQAGGTGTETLPAQMTGKRLSTGGVELKIELGASVVVTRLRVIAQSREIEFTSDDGAQTERFRIERYAAFTGLGELIVTGQAEESGQAVDVRILYSVEPGTLTWTRDARPPGGEFKFRQRYTMRRAR
jgi:hypothetical protein